MKKFCVFIASGFGLGLIAPFAPGTFGSIPGVALAYAVSLLPIWWQIIAALAFTLLAIPVCDVAEKYFMIKDDGRITADEWMLFPIAAIGIPLMDMPWWTMLIFFVIVRIVDIVKPWPARQLQSMHGGFGIVIDDFFANVYSLALNWLVYSLLLFSL